MKSVNSMRVSFPSKSVNENLGRSVVAAFAAMADPTVAELCDIRTAVSEAVTNCIVHGYRDGAGTVYITAALYPDGQLAIRIRDTGCGIEDVEKAMRPLFTTAPEQERAGLGFAVMQELCDRVRVISTPGKGTTVVLVKKLGKNGE